RAGVAALPGPGGAAPRGDPPRSAKRGGKSNEPAGPLPRANRPEARSAEGSPMSLVADWYSPRPSPLAIALRPLALAFGTGVALRRALYRAGLRKSVALAVPVVIVGNITVGGSGKTPLVAALVRALAQRGFHPGVVSRGYGRDRGDDAPILVDA